MALKSILFETDLNMTRFYYIGFTVQIVAVQILNEKHINCNTHLLKSLSYLSVVTDFFFYKTDPYFKCNTVPGELPYNTHVMKMSK